tara:strand:- start:297 stop:854 length:558 start_codon:yes stop_codon:yes gene_type:complete
MLDTIRKEFKYKKIKSFLSKDEIDLLTNYCKIQHSVNQNNFDVTQSINQDTYLNNDATMTSLLIKKLPLMEQYTNKKLFPTYTFWRMYSYGADLAKHKDRPACEISVTVNINNDGTPWPIYMEGESVDLAPGDGVIYLGCELEHWREQFKGDWCAQVFMHYVDQEGPYAGWKWDQRKFNGLEIVN